MITKYTRILVTGDYGMLALGPEVLVEAAGEDAGEEASNEVTGSWRGDRGKCLHLRFSNFGLT